RTGMARKTPMRLSTILLGAVTMGCSGADPPGGLAVDTTASALDTVLENNVEFANASGESASFSTAGSVDLTGTFFQSIGTNGRTCNTCHLASDGWTVSAASAQSTFDASGGTAALFEFDGQNCPGADRSTVEARRAASSLMLNRGVVRFNRAIPANAEFE